MKKFAFITLAAGLMLTACGPKQATEGNAETMLDQSLAQARTFADSAAIIEGYSIGASINAQVFCNPNNNMDLNKAEFLRGLREAMKADTTFNMSYSYGLMVGSNILRNFVQMSDGEQMSREKFMQAFSEAFALDSVSEEAVMNIMGLEQSIQSTLQERAAERARQEAYNTREAQENRELASAWLDKDGKEYTAVGTDGIYEKVVTPGAEEALDGNARVDVTYSLRKIDGTEIAGIQQPRKMYVASPTVPFLRPVLKLMHVGETAEFYLPYQEAFGEVGNAQAGVGPCESLLLTVTVHPDAE